MERLFGMKHNIQRQKSWTDSSTKFKGLNDHARYIKLVNADRCYFRSFRIRFTIFVWQLQQEWFKFCVFNVSLGHGLVSHFRQLLVSIFFKTGYPGFPIWLSLRCSRLKGTYSVNHHEVIIITTHIIIFFKQFLTKSRRTKNQIGLTSLSLQKQLLMWNSSKRTCRSVLKRYNPATNDRLSVCLQKWSLRSMENVLLHAF